MGASDDLARSFGVEPSGLALEARLHTARQLKAFGGANEEQIASAFPFPSASLYVNPAGDAGLVGAILRLYVIAHEIRYLVRAATILSVATPIRVAGYGRGGTRWEATIQLATAASVAAKHAYILSSHDGAGTAWDLACSRNVRPADDPNFANAFAQLSVPSTTPGVRLLAITGTNNGAAAAWLQIFDNAVNPAPGDTPIARALVQAGQSFSMNFVDPGDLPPSGRLMTTGISWATTANAATYAAGSGQTFDVTTKFV